MTGIFKGEGTAETVRERKQGMELRDSSMRDFVIGRGGRGGHVTGIGKEEENEEENEEDCDDDDEKEEEEEEEEEALCESEC